jgi:hypothetical protein
VTEELRHHCRRCRIKLTAPVSNPLDAFCTRGCFRIHFQYKCLICERKKSGKGLACNHPKCRSELASKKRYSTRGKYVEKGIVAHDSGRRRDASKTSNSIALASPLIGPFDPPVNVIGGYRFALAPNLPPAVRAEILRYR